MLPAWCVVFSLLLRLYSGGRYAYAVIQRQASPNPISWLLWGFASLIAFAAQLDHIQAQSYATLVLGITPLCIGTLAIFHSGFTTHITRFNIICASLSVVGIVMWQITGNAALAILFAMVSDAFACLPTLKNAFHNPTCEYGPSYLLSAMGMCIVIFTITDWNFVIYAFPIYIILMNVTIFMFATLPLKKWAIRFSPVTSSDE